MNDPENSDLWDVESEADFKQQIELLETSAFNSTQKIYGVLPLPKKEINKVNPLGNFPKIVASKKDQSLSESPVIQSLKASSAFNDSVDAPAKTNPVVFDPLPPKNSYNPSSFNGPPPSLAIKENNLEFRNPPPNLLLYKSPLKPELLPSAPPPINLPPPMLNPQNYPSIPILNPQSYPSVPILNPQSYPSIPANSLNPLQSSNTPIPNPGIQLNSNFEVPYQNIQIKSQFNMLNHNIPGQSQYMVPKLNPEVLESSPEGKIFIPPRGYENSIAFISQSQVLDRKIPKNHFAKKPNSKEVIIDDSKKNIKPQYSERIPNLNQPRRFEIDRELEHKIKGFSSAFPHLNPQAIKRIIIENQGFTEEEICIKIYTELESAPVYPVQTNLQTYKSYPCPLNRDCQNINCGLYHFLGEKRRVPVIYSDTLCKNYPKCEKEDSCEYSHTITEVIYHPKTLKSTQCPLKVCIWGESCVFYHEINPKLSLLDRLKIELDNCTNTKIALDQTKTEISEALEKEISVKHKILKKVYCKNCNINKVSVVRVPCGHCVCNICSMGPLCPVCGINSKSINLSK